MKKFTKLFSRFNTEDGELDSLVNQWIEENNVDVDDIKLAVSTVNSDGFVECFEAICVVYKAEKPVE